MTLPVVIYTRLSRDETGTQTATRRQEQACRAFTELRDWKVAEVFEDVDISAYQRGVVRPGYEDMLKVLERRRAAGVVVWKLDRLVRRPAEFERFWSLCESHDVFLASATEPIDSSTELGLALVRILVTFASLESATIAVRTRARQRELAVAGHPPGGKVYGLTLDWRTLIPEEAAVIRESARRVLAGEAVNAITRDWNERGIPGPRGRPWHESTLRTMLRSPRLVGDRAYRGEVVAQDCWPAVLDRLTGARLANRLARTGPGRRPRVASRLASGLCRCGRCSQELLVTARENGVYYGCPSRPTGCGRVYVKADHLEHWLVHAVLHRMAVPDRVTGEQPDEAELERLLREEAEALSALSADYYARGDIGRSEFLSARAAILTHFEAQRRQVSPAWRSDRLAFMADPDPRRAWLRLCIDDRRAAIQADVRAVVVHPARRRGTFDSSRLELELWDDGGTVDTALCPDPTTCVLRHDPDCVGSVVLDPSQDWLDGKQVARVLAVSPRIVWDAIRRGLLPAERQHRRYRVRRGDVTEFLRRTRVTPGSLAALIHRHGGQVRPAAAVRAPGAGETWLSTSQVMATLSLTRSQLYRAIDDGVVPAYRFGRVIRIRQTELDELAACQPWDGAPQSGGTDAGSRRTLGPSGTSPGCRYDVHPRGDPAARPATSPEGAGPLV